MEYLKVPTKIIMNGDPVLCKRFIRFAQVQLLILRNQMKFRGLKQDTRQLRPQDNIQIDCWSTFALSEVTITEIPPVERKKPINKKCFCSCMFSVGQVQSFTEQIPVYGYGEKDVLYDLLICQRERSFVLFKNCRPSDFAEYEFTDTNELVVVVLASMASYETACCQETITTPIDLPACEQIPPTDNTVIFRVIPVMVKAGLPTWTKVKDIPE